jgi:hypothetical protein
VTISKLLWGTGFENEVRIGYPLFDVVTDREERDGSEHIQAPSGVEDSWLTGRDYTLDTEVRWIPDGPNTSPVQTQLSGPVSWQEFLDWARDANAFRFVPDENVPDFYVDNTYLVEPRKGFGSLSSDIKRNVRLKLRNPVKDFHEALRGIMFEYAPGASLTDPLAASFTRGSEATRRGLPGNLAAAIGASDASGVLRDRHYEKSLRTTLLEAARTQLVTDPENFGNWTAVNVTRTAGQADPFGGTGAYKLEATAGADNRIQQAVAGFTAGTRAVLCFLRADPTSAQSNLIVTSGSVIRHHVRVTWTAGVPSLSTIAGTGTLFGVAPWGAGWYVILINADNVAASDIIQIYPAATGGTGTVYAFGANAWNAVFPSSYQGPSLTTRNADQFSRPYAHRPQAIFVYQKFVERGSTQGTGTIRQWRIGGGAGGTTPPFLYITFNTQYGTRLDFGTGVTSAIISTVPAFGDVVEFLVTMTAAGLMQVSMILNGGAPIVGTAAGAQALAAAWTDPTFYFPNHIGDGLTALANLKHGPLTFGGVIRDTIAKALAA